MIKLLLMAVLLIWSTISTASNTDTSNFYWRPGYTYLALDASSSEVSLNGLNDTASLALSAGPVTGSSVNVEGDGRFSVVLGYKLDDHWSIETIVAPPFEFDLGFDGRLRDESIAPTALGTVPTGIEPFGPRLGTIKSLPAVVTLTRALSPKGDWRPYYGFGLTYVYTFDPTLENTVLLERGEPSLEVSSDWGLILQLGTSWLYSERLEFNVDLKYGTSLALSGKVRNITLNSPGLSDLFGDATADSATVDLSLRALVGNVSVRWKF